MKVRTVADDISTICHATGGDPEAPGPAEMFLCQTRANARHESRVEATLVEAQKFVGAPAKLDDYDAQYVRHGQVLAIALDLHGVGGYHGAGGDSRGTARLLGGLGKCRWHASDGEAYRAAAEAAIRLLVAGLIPWDSKMTFGARIIPGPGPALTVWEHDGCFTSFDVEWFQVRRACAWLAAYVRHHLLETMAPAWATLYNLLAQDEDYRREAVVSGKLALDAEGVLTMEGTRQEYLLGDHLDPESPIGQVVEDMDPADGKSPLWALGLKWGLYTLEVF